jgi:outer membrane protein assembly factor BamB
LEFPDGRSLLGIPALNPQEDTVYCTWAYDKKKRWQGHVYSVRSSSGSQNWEIILPGGGSWTGNHLAVDQTGVLYVVDCSNPDGMVNAINPDGTFKWSVPVPDVGGEEDLFALSVDEARAHLITGGWNSERRVICLSTSDGSHLWSVWTGSATGISACVDPSSGTVYHPGSDGILRAISSDGNPIWSANLSVVSTPALSRDGSMIYCPGSSAFYAVNSTDGSVAWSKPIGSSSSPAVDGNGDVIVPSSDGHLYLLSGSSGNTLWDVLVTTNPLSPIACAGWEDRIWIYVTASDTVYGLSALSVEAKENLPEGFGVEFKTAGKSIYLFMPKEAQVSLTLYDAQGRLVQRLYDGVLSSGGHTFNPTLEAKGVYMVVLRYQGGMRSLKFIR